ncbi:MAG: multicopper oxidase family protein, partial [Gemmatimonadales bacterium]|nr:multicopper oxidase family protein [Gemmatimonadales bacterium]
RLSALLVLLSASFTSAAAQRPCDPPAPLGPSRDLYCIELIPAPGIRGASGLVELGHVPGPFTVASTSDGRLRHHLTLVVSGLPSPESLGPFRTYVAWVAPPVMHPVQRLGQVANGRVDLGVVDLEKFVVVVTAETTAQVKEPDGRVVLRGQSPSTRLFPPDLLEFSIGSMGQEPGGGHQEHRGAASPTDSGARWTTVPMPPGLAMLPAEMALRPEVTPFLPSGPAPAARPRETVRVGPGDTLRLEAGLAERSLKGKRYTMYAFNGQYPGPLIETVRGSEITVAFTNRLPHPTTVHWHGIRLDHRNDGVPQLSQPVVRPGGKFIYRLRFPDTGVYWYHPHVREDVQQELGLYGNLLVRPAVGEQYGPASREAVLMLDDILIGEKGLVPLGGESPTHALMGRFGSTFLVNGEPGYRLQVGRGEVVRFYLTNAANTRTFNLSFPGARMKVVASDVGPYAREAWVESVVIGPAERYVIHVRFDHPGTVALVNRVRGLDHLYGRFFSEVDTLGTVEVGRRGAAGGQGGAFAALRRDTAAGAEMERFRRRAAGAPTQALVLTLEARGLPPVTQRLMQLDSIYFAPMEWSGTMPMMNWASTGRQVRWIVRDPATGRENMDVDWRLRRGEPVRIRLVNQRRSFHAMQHPIHLHGQRFLVLSVNGVPNENLVWKDTVLLPAGAAVDILLDPSNPGRWMLHCHIAEHLSAGMMMGFTVE